MSLTRTIDHAEAGKQQLLEQFRGKPRIEAMVAAWLDQVQELELAIWARMGQRVLSDAEGVALNVIGRIVGQTRGGRSDAEYRVWIAARIAANHSSGTPEELYRLVALLVPVGTQLRIVEEYPGALTFYADDPIDGQDGVQIALVLQDAKAAGVRLQFNWHQYLPVFAFDAAGGTDVATDGFGNGHLAAVNEGDAEMQYPQWNLDFSDPDNSHWLAGI